MDCTNIFQKVTGGSLTSRVLIESENDNEKVRQCISNENHHPAYQLHLRQSLFKCIILANVFLVVYGNEVVDVHNSVHEGIQSANH